MAVLNKSEKFLSDLTIYSKYANYLKEEKRRQVWEEAIDILMNMHIKRYPHLKAEIRKNFLMVYDKVVLPSMRSVQFGGLPIEFAPNRIFNCAYAPLNHKYAFTELLFLLLGGTGMGYSVRKHHVAQLPFIKLPQGEKRFLIGDSIEGWADSIRHLMEAYVSGKPLPRFDYRDIRPKGSLIKKTGGKAPGPGKLIEAHNNMIAVLNQAVGRYLTTLESHDLACYLAACVTDGGIREAAMIALFDKDDQDMLHCKSIFDATYVSHTEDEKFWYVIIKTTAKHYYGDADTPFEIKMTKEYGDWDFTQLTETGKIAWYYIHPQRGRSNNSVALNRNTATQEEFMAIMKACENSKAGEPGVYWCNNDEDGANPCVEIGLLPNQFCNLTTAVVYDCQTQEELEKRVRAAAFIGTLQASYTDFHMLRPIWKENTEKEALLGVSLTGIASGDILKLDIRAAAIAATEENKRVAALLGINPAARVTCIKPEGSGTLVAGAMGSGVHAVHSQYYIRNNRIKKGEPMYYHLMDIMPQFIEDEFQKEDIKAVVSIPMMAKPGSITRDESAIEFLERVKLFHTDWIEPGHFSGSGTHNVSATVNIREDEGNNEWEGVTNWMWENRGSYNGISCLPYSGGSYKQAPFIEITKEKYYEMMHQFPENVDFSSIVEEENNVDLVNELACGAGGACLI